jgi:hypothetical protein
MKAIINQQPVQKALGYSFDKYPKNTVFTPVVNVKQCESASCGPAALTSVLKTMGRKVTERKLIQEATKELRAKNMNMDTHGTPPEIIKNILKRNRVKYIESTKDSAYKSAAIKAKAQKKLDRMLKNGFICITPVQMTPEYWCVERETCKVVKKSYNPVKCSKDLYDTVKVLSSEESKPKTRNKVKLENKDGHYVVITGMIKDDKDEYYVTMDPALSYWRESYKDGTPAKYKGMRILPKKLFVDQWHDISGDNKPYYHYLIGVKPRFASKSIL